MPGSKLLGTRVPTPSRTEPYIDMFMAAESVRCMLKHTVRRHTSETSIQSDK